MTSPDTSPGATSAPAGNLKRNALLGAGGVALAAVGLAGGLALRSPPPPAASEAVPPAAVSADVAPRASLAADEAVVPQSVPPANANPPLQEVPVRPHHPVPPAHVPRHAAPPPRYADSRSPLATTPAVVCANCGVVEGVREVRQKGAGTGLGAVAGGVLGGVVGNQVGHGNGRAAMTVLGALGGGLAGNEVEKRSRSETVYEVHVRMDDGSLRTLTLGTAPTPGARVVVDGKNLRAAGPHGGERMVRTSGGA